MDDEPLTPFEERLREIAPAAPSEVLRGRLAEQLQPRRTAWRPYALGLAGLSAAACVGIGVVVAVMTSTKAPAVIDPISESLQIDPEPVVPHLGPDPISETPAPPGSLLAYHRAMRRSPDSAMDVLDRTEADSKRPRLGRRETLRPLDTDTFLSDHERPNDEINALPDGAPAVRVVRHGAGRCAHRAI